MLNAAVILGVSFLHLTTMCMRDDLKIRSEAAGGLQKQVPQEKSFISIFLSGNISGSSGLLNTRFPLFSGFVKKYTAEKCDDG